MKKTLLSLILVVLMASGSAALSEGYILLKGDLHVHSDYSGDSQVPADQVITESISAGYDFICLTEHDTKSHLHEDHSVEGLIVIPGYEMTMTGLHCNVFGIREFVLNGELGGKRLMKYIEYLKSLGAMIQIDHPNHETYGSGYGYDVDFDLIEAINGRVTADDLQTIADYQTLLVSGRKIVVTGGTDKHSEHKDRHVFNYVLASDRTSDAILEGIRAGRVYVATALDGPEISMVCGDAVMGSTVAFAEGQTVDISIEIVPSGSSVKVYTSSGLYSETAVTDSYFLSVPTAGCSFVRCEVWQGEEVAAISNPIYITK